MPGRRSDRDRILALLSETQGLSNLKIKNELNLSDDRYARLRQELVEEGLAAAYVCRGGGVRLTRKGEKEGLEENGAQSAFENEAAIYPHLAEFLKAQAKEDKVEAIICSTHSLKQRGQWQNPDVTQVAIEYYAHLRKLRVKVTTYEVKQFPRWNVSVVYEAASHHRFSHEAYVVLDWPNGLPFSITDPTYKLDQITRECQRFGVGLATLHGYYTKYRLRPRIEAEPRAADDEDVELWLDYMFSRDASSAKDFERRMRIVQKRLAKGVTSGGGS